MLLPHPVGRWGTLSSRVKTGSEILDLLVLKSLVRPKFEYI